MEINDLFDLTMQIMATKYNHNNNIATKLIVGGDDDDFSLLLSSNFQRLFRHSLERVPKETCSFELFVTFGEQR